MLFNSYEFIFFFLPIVFCVYFFLNAIKQDVWGRVFLILSCFFFYSYYNVTYLPLIIISVLFNYSIGQYLIKEHAAYKKPLLLLGIACNIALLGFFKYTDFLIENVNALFSLEINLLHLALPLAISFFTFQQIAYLADCYSGKVKASKFLDYVTFVTFFPQLIAGPIVHHKEMMPQFVDKKNKSINFDNIALGLFIFSIGLFKKVVIADSFAPIVNQGFDEANMLTFIEGWVVSLSYSFQLYFDFSGYADMAIGLALLFNIKLPINFFSPYRAQTIQEFWRRWHITLGRFLKDYIYIPLGGNRNGNINLYTNLMITFIFGGIWHGAAWTFVFWGALHGAALVIHRVWAVFNIKIWGWLAWVLTFNFVNISWVFFRAENWDDAIKVIKAMLGLNGIVLPRFLNEELSILSQYGVVFGGYLDNIKADIWAIAWVISGIFIVLVFKNSIQLMEGFRYKVRYLLLNIVLLFIALLSLDRYQEFLYFNF